MDPIHRLPSDGHLTQSNLAARQMSNEVYTRSLLTAYLRRQRSLSRFEAIEERGVLPPMSGVEREISESGESRAAVPVVPSPAVLFERLRRRLLQVRSDVPIEAICTPAS